jgi:hypothetical protein
VRVSGQINQLIYYLMAPYSYLSNEPTRSFEDHFLWLVEVTHQQHKHRGKGSGNGRWSSWDALAPRTARNIDEE